MNSLSFGAFLVAGLLFAADPVTVWTNADVTAKLHSATADKNQTTQDSLGHFSGYSMSVTKREASGIGEMHEATTDIFVVQSGECTLVTGGKLANPKNQSAGEVRGSSVEGGEKRHLVAGDVVRIPAKVPHQMLLDAGKNIVYAVVKVEGK